MANESLDVVMDGVDEVGPLRGVASLRRLARRGEEIEALLEVVSEDADALEGLFDMADALDNLDDHRATLERLADLPDLADNVEQLARAMRVVRRHRDELELADEAEASGP